MCYICSYCCICLCDKTEKKCLSDANSDISYYTKLTKLIPEMCFKEMNDQRLLCMECCRIVDDIYKFREKCIESKVKLIDYMNKLHTESILNYDSNITSINCNQFWSSDCDKTDKNPRKEEIFMECVEKNKKDKLIANFGSHFLSKIDDRKKIDDFLSNDVPTDYKDTKISLNNEGGKNQQITKDIIDIESFGRPLKSENNGGSTCHLNNVADMQINTESNLGSSALLIDFQKLEDKEIVCKICNELFSYRYQLKVHMRIHTSTTTNTIKKPEDSKISNLTLRTVKKTHNCTICKQKFTASSGLKKHMKKCSAIIKEIVLETYIGKYNCEVCHKKFKIKPHLEEHIAAWHSGQKPYECVVCNQKFGVPQNLKSHSIKKHDSVIDFIENKFECNECHTKFPRNIDLFVHMRIHSGEKPYECEICGVKLARRCEFNSHMILHKKPDEIVTKDKNNARKFECNLCDKKFLRNDTLIIHMRIHTGEKPYECDLCKMKFARKSCLSRHIVTHECSVCKKSFNKVDLFKEHMITHSASIEEIIGNYSCETCQKRFKLKPKLEEHILMYHSGEKPYECSMCNEKYSQPRLLKDHMIKYHDTVLQVVENKFECGLCHKKFSRKITLVEHMRIHSGEKPYKCEICNKTFVRDSNLNMHMSTHIAENQAQEVCNICGKIFNYRHLLLQHMIIHREKRYTCEICGRKFSKNVLLTTHMRVHTGEKPFECPICSVRFTQKSSLRVHKRLHTGNIPFECEFCQKKFNGRGQLNEHRRYHTGERPYVCNLCRKGFVSANKLKKHKLICTPV